MGRSISFVARPGDREIVSRRDPAGRGRQDGPLLLDVRPPVLLDEDHRRCPGVRRKEGARRASGARTRPDREGGGVQEERPGDLSITLNVIRYSLNVKDMMRFSLYHLYD